VQRRHTHNTCSTVLQSLSALTLQRWNTAITACTITGPVSLRCAQCTRSDRRSYQQQHAHNTTLPPRSDHNTCARTTEWTGAHNRTQPMTSSVAQYTGRVRCSIANRTNTRWQRCVRITTDSHARATRARCIISAHNAPHNSRSTEHASIRIVARRRHSQCTKQLAGVAHDSDFNVQYNTVAPHGVRDATYVSAVRLPMLSGMVPRMLRPPVLNDVLRQ
jgi:hypothetical protein